MFIMQDLNKREEEAKVCDRKMGMEAVRITADWSMRYGVEVSLPIIKDKNEMQQ